MISRLSQLIFRDFRRAWVGILISVICLGFVFSIANIDDFLTSLQLADYRYFPWAILVFVLSMVCRTFAWRTVLKEDATPRRIFITLNEGYLFNNILPFRLGEVVRAFMLNRTTGIPFLRVISTILIERIFDLLMVVGLLLLTIPFVIGADWARPTAIGLGAAMLIGLVILNLIARNRDRALRVFSWFQTKVAVLKKVSTIQLDTFFEGLETVRDARRFFTVSFWMVASWVLIVFEYYLLALAFFPDAKFIWAAFGIGVVGLGVAIPAAPGGIGVVQVGIVWVFALFGADESVALAYSVLVHTVYLVITSGIGAFGLYLDGESILDVYEQVRARLRSRPADENGSGKMAGEGRKAEN